LDGSLDCTQCEDKYQIDDTTKQCYKCADECDSCVGPTKDDCPTCHDGYFQLPDTTTCDDFCPTGLSENSGTNECDVTDEFSYCFEWRDKVIELGAADGVAVSMESGATDSPIPVYERGIYFDGIRTLSVAGLVLNTRFALEFWIRPEITGATDCHLFEIASGTTVMSVSVLGSAVSIHLGGGAVALTDLSDDVWTHLAITVGVRPDPITAVRSAQDDAATGYGTLDSPLIDNPAYAHILGTSYLGFLYKFCAHQFAKTRFDVINPSSCKADVRCSSCP
jgi:hypothetical protein